MFENLKTKLERFKREIPETNNFTTRFDDILILKYLFLLGEQIIRLLLILVLGIPTILFIIPDLLFLLFGKINNKKKLKITKEIVNKYYEQHKTLPPYILKDYNKNVLIVGKEVTLRGFIHYFISIYNNNHDTYDHSNNFVCETGRRRSIGDIYLICKNYFPGATVDQVITNLVDLAEAGYIYGSYCNTINKYVFHVASRNYITDCSVEHSRNLRFKDLVETYKTK